MWPGMATMTVATSTTTEDPMSNDHPTTRFGTRTRTRWLFALAVVVLVAAGCGEGSDDAAEGGDTTTAPTVAPTTEASPPPSSPAGTTPAEDEALAEAALLADGDLEGWSVAPPEYQFPNDVEAARTVPECAELAEVVFAGGTEHGRGASGVLARDADLLFTYVVVFPSEAEATAMLDATADPAFDDCWAGFNAAVVPDLMGADGASYEPAEPPDLTIDADQIDIEHLTGSIDMDGIALSDTCVCVFARSGRGVVEVHSTEPVFDDEARAAAVQVAIDKLTETLSA